MTEEEHFYFERDRRTRECGVSDGLDVPVRFVVGHDVAGSPRGQATSLALVNMLARIHRHVQFEIPPVELLIPWLTPSRRLDDAAASLARAIDPYIRVNEGPASPHAIGLGGDLPTGLPWYAGAQEQIAIIDRNPIPFDPGNRLSLGSALAACLGAAALLRQVLGQDQRPATLSAWNFREGAEAERGPDLAGPVDVGNVLMIGAGGVGSCLAYWLSQFGVQGLWYVIDRDFAVLHNTNRCLGLFPRDTDWFGEIPRNKAITAAELFGASGEAVWYDEFDHDSFKPDLVLPLANQREVRHAVACRGEPIILHSTTSRAWEAQLHRHIPDQDDCITCRMPQPTSQVQLACATVPIERSGESSTDAALPFLSATAGLLLLAGLYKLQLGQLALGRHNLWAVCFRDERRHARPAIYPHCSRCTTTLPASARHRIHAGRRWSHVAS